MNDLSEESRELLRAHGRGAIADLARRHNLRATEDRIQCPFECRAEGKDKLNASFYVSRHGIDKVMCHRCKRGGDYADLLIELEGGDTKSAFDKMRASGLTAPTERRQPTPLVVVPRGTAAPEKDNKLPHHKVKAIWDALAEGDEQGESYLASRTMTTATKLGVVRFATENHPDPAIRMHAKQGRRIAMRLLDIHGNHVGIQFRLARATQSTEHKILSLRGGSNNGWFGTPDLIENAPVVCVCEGMADTLACVEWAHYAIDDSLAIVGAPGKNQLPKLAAHLEEAGISPTGRVFLLFPQNDAPRNMSRREFARLAQLLSRAGAHVVWCNTAPEFKDLADWRNAEGADPWPPREYAQWAGRDDGEGEVAAEDRFIQGPGGVMIPAQSGVEMFGKDTETVLALLDDKLHREAIMGRGELTLNVMTQEVCFNGRTLDDNAVTWVRAGIERYARTGDGKKLKFPPEEIRSALLAIGSKKPFHPIEEWLVGLRWDGTHRVDAGLPVSLGQQQGGLQALLLRRWMLGCVARALRPGCKMDTVLVLVGPQGIGKSTFFSIMGGEWFTDEAVNLADKDSKMILGRAWLLEWAELESMRRARDQEAIKAFLSQQVDLFRPPYGRNLVAVPRTSVIVGTTNSKQFLSDPSGNRRFWPIEVERVDQDWLRANRDQLWAEAVDAFRTGEQWWLEPEAEPFLAQAHEDFKETDTWEPLVSDFISLRTEVTTAEVLEKAIGKPAGQWSKSDAMRVAAVLRSLLWVRTKVRRGQTTLWAFRHPESVPTRQAFPLSVPSVRLSGNAKSVEATDASRSVPTVPT